MVCVRSGVFQRGEHMAFQQTNWRDASITNVRRMQTIWALRDNDPLSIDQQIAFYQEARKIALGQIHSGEDRAKFWSIFVNTLRMLVAATCSDNTDINTAFD